MPYLDEAGLAHYNPKIKEWISSQPVKTIPPSLYPWTLSDKAGAVTCWPVGGTELLPTVDFLFSESGPASGDKGPENPSTITGVSSVKVTRCGKNILSYPFAEAGKTENDLTITPSSTDGTVIINGTASADTYYNITWTSTSPKLPLGTKCVLSGTPSGGSYDTYYMRASNYASAGKRDDGSGGFITLTDKALGNIGIVVRSGTALSNAVFKPQLEIGQTLTPFEKGGSVDTYTIPLGSTYYGGSIDLATGVMTVTHVECVADGTNIYAQSSVGDIGVFYRHAINVVSFGLPAPIIGDYESSSSTHFACISGLFGSFGVFSQASQYIIVCDKDGLYPTNQSFNDWLKAQNASGTPVRFVYTVANPFTVQLTPTQILALPQPNKYVPRINTVYTDAQAVQVGYVKSPIREEFELTQAIVAQGGNI